MIMDSKDFVNFIIKSSLLSLTKPKIVRDTGRFSFDFMHYYDPVATGYLTIVFRDKIVDQNVRLVYYEGNIETVYKNDPVARRVTVNLTSSNDIYSSLFSAIPDQQRLIKDLLEIMPDFYKDVTNTILRNNLFVRSTEI